MLIPEHVYRQQFGTRWLISALNLNYKQVHEALISNALWSLRELESGLGRAEQVGGHFRVEWKLVLQSH